jgi:hypothetical protein
MHAQEEATPKAPPARTLPMMPPPLRPPTGLGGSSLDMGNVRPVSSMCQYDFGIACKTCSISMCLSCTYLSYSCNLFRDFFDNHIPDMIQSCA